MVEKFGSYVYDTENSRKVGTRAEGAFGDADGFEENLYQTKRRMYFLHGIGGSQSKYEQETIVPIKADQAKEWMEQYIN
ncbi:MAG: hypothetical protein FWH14_06930 [Oscillospiraceae bacterium]|nr:hypothetical protein [Oscillospiraceae bacterium]